MQNQREPVWTSAPVAYITTLTSQLTIGPPSAAHALSAPPPLSPPRPAASPPMASPAASPAATIPSPTPSPPACDMDESLARLSLRAPAAAPPVRAIALPRATAAAVTTSATALAAPGRLDDDAERGRDAATAAAELLRHLMPPPSAPFAVPTSSSRPVPAAGSRRTFSITETPSNSPSGPSLSKFAPPTKRHHRSTSSEDAISASPVASSLSSSPQHPSVALFGSAPVHDDATDDHELSFLVGQIEMSDRSVDKHMPYIA